VNGGEVLTRQQMRNAMFSGAATIFLRDEAATDLFRKATGESLDQKTMRDREFVNRFCSFSLLELDTYKGDMDDWLARGLTHLGKLNDIDQAALRGKFHRALQNNLTVFGKHAFRKHRRFDQSRSILNASLFDVMACALAVRKEENVDERAEKLRTSFYSRMDDERFNRAITYGPNSQKEVVTRFEIVEAMMKEVFDAQ
jgi:hypothetical protein